LLAVEICNPIVWGYTTGRIIAVNDKKPMAKKQLNLLARLEITAKIKKLLETAHRTHRDYRKKL
jgi:hypothetical protein